MLSAVAARKAALAQSRNTSTDALPTLAADVASSGSKSSHTTAKPPSVRKRKSSASIPQSTSRPKKPKSKSDGFASEENDKAVLQNTWSRDCAVEDSMQVDHDLIPRPHELPAPSAVALTGKRQWSPSRPVDGSSSSDDDDNVDHSADHSAFPLAIPPPPHAIEEAIVLSTFTPVEGQNTFGLEQEELEVLYGSSSSSALNVAIVILRPRETLCLLGTYQLSVLRGSITIDGTILTPSRESHHVFAPRSSPLPIIRHRSMEEIALVEVDGVPARISRKAGKDDVLLAFRELRTGVEALGSVLPRFSGVFQRESRDSSFSTDANDLRLSGAHLIRFSSPTVQPFVLSSSWETSLEDILSDVQDEEHAKQTMMDAPVCLVRGPKKTGKSTFARTLLNRLLSRYCHVAFLECDLGQSEFTPAGMVALNIFSKPVLGPSFTHQTIPHSAHYIGATTPRDVPAHYIAAVDACLGVYRLDIARAVDLPDQLNTNDEDGRIADFVPLVVNTMGWTKGLGADLNQQIVALVAPTHTFEFSPLPYGDRSSPFQVTPSTAEATGCGSVRYLDPIESPLSAYFTAADHRALNILSYFHSVFPTTPDPRSAIVKAWNPVHLLARPPYQVQWRTGLPGGLILSAPGAEDVVPEEVALALPGAIVALTTEDADAALDEAPESQSRHNPMFNYTQGRPAPLPRTSHCLGLALIRGLSTSPYSQPQPSDNPSSAPSAGAAVQILTPIPPVLLRQARTAVKGALELPIWGMVDASSKEDGMAGWPRARVPYLRWANVRDDAQPQGADRRRVRRNLMRKGQM